jgi:hypothetical protein
MSNLCRSFFGTLEEVVNAPPHVPHLLAQHTCLQKYVPEMPPYRLQNGTPVSTVVDVGLLGGTRTRLVGARPPPDGGPDPAVKLILGLENWT